MELTKKTTILLTPELHRRLSRLAKSRGVSLGQLVREACEVRYGVVGTASRLEAAGALAALGLPVAPPDVLKRESVPGPDDLVP